MARGKGRSQSYSDRDLPIKVRSPSQSDNSRQNSSFFGSLRPFFFLMALIVTLCPLASVQTLADEFDSLDFSFLDMSAAQSLIDNPWGKVTTPTTGVAQSIGSYAEGCIRGAQALPESGDGYQTMHPLRRRLFGHPDLITFITSFARQTHIANKGDVLIGDMGQPRGGPTLTGHASHQIGLDVDIWLWQPGMGQVLTATEREQTSSTSYVVEDFERLENNWRDSKLDLLKTAALSNRVQRIFINPVIKRRACQIYPGQNWLQKLRPWWGHDDHFHVRLYCPVGDTHCTPQAAVPAGPGCDASLDDWFTAEIKAKAKLMREHPAPAEMPILPTLCAKVLTEN